jgi:hypothetical protein
MSISSDEKSSNRSSLVNAPYFGGTLVLMQLGVDEKLLSI